MSAQESPALSALERSGICKLNALSGPADIGPVLKTFAAIAAGLDPVERQLARKEAMAALDANGVKGVASALDAALRLGSSAAEGDRTPGIAFEEPAGWETEVDGSELLTNIVDLINRHVSVSHDAAIAMALWVLHSHTIEIAYCSPRLALISPTMRCGKTTAMSVMSALVARPLTVSSISTAAFFRSIEAYKPTLLIDEADTFLNTRDEFGGVLNDGHGRDGKVLRCDGDKHDVRAYPVFAPVVVGSIGRLRETLMDRSIVVDMQRLGPGESVAPLRRRQRAAATATKRKCIRWAVDNLERLGAIQEAGVDSPAELNDRAGDNWEVLIAIADTVGGGWPERAQGAARRLSSMAANDNGAGSWPLQLLGDVHGLLNGELAGQERVAMAHLVRLLVAMEERPWSDARNGQPINTAFLGKQLRHFHIKPKTMRFAPKPSKGYERTAFDDAFRRYLPSEPVTPVTDAESRREVADRDGLHAASVTAREGTKKPCESNDVTAVTELQGRYLAAIDTCMRAVVIEGDC